MKQKELRQLASCAACGCGTGKSIVFHRVVIDRFVIDIDACQRQDGLGAFLGGHHLLADIMGPNEDLANQVGETITFSLCNPCFAKQFPQIHERLGASINSSTKEVTR